MRTRTKYALAIVVATAVALFVVMQRRKPPTDVTIESVEPRDLVASVTASGRVRSHTKVDISTDISGRITRLAVKEGDMVRKGQFLLEIDPSAYRAAVERAVAAVAASKARTAQAQASLLQAQNTYNRTAELKRRNPNLVSNEQIEQLETAVKVNKALWESARNDVGQATASLQDAQSALAKTTVIAPIQGRITRLNVEQGETAIMGTLNKDAATLLTVSDMSVLETKVKVDETDVSRIKIGDSAMVQLDAFPDTTFGGRVTEVSNSSTNNTGLGGGSNTDQAVDYEVTVRLLDPPTTTRPDFSATAKIITDTRHQVLTIPIIALTVRDRPLGGSEEGDSVAAYAKQSTKTVGQKDIEGVFVVGNDNRAMFRRVKVGVASDRYFEVLSGLRQGERVVSGTYQTIRALKDSTKVHQITRTTSADSTGK